MSLYLPAQTSKRITSVSSASDLTGRLKYKNQALQTNMRTFSNNQINHLAITEIRTNLFSTLVKHSLVLIPTRHIQI